MFDFVRCVVKATVALYFGVTFKTQHVNSKLLAVMR